MESDADPSLWLTENALGERRLLCLGTVRVCQPREYTAPGERGCSRLAPNSVRLPMPGARAGGGWQVKRVLQCPQHFASAAWQSHQETSHALLCRCKRCFGHPSWLFPIRRSTRDLVWGAETHGEKEKALWLSLFTPLFPSPQSILTWSQSFFLKQTFLSCCHTSCTFTVFTFLSPYISFQAKLGLISYLLPPVPLLHTPLSTWMGLLWAVLQAARGVWGVCVVKALCGWAQLVHQHPSECMLPSATDGWGLR